MRKTALILVGLLAITSTAIASSIVVTGNWTGAAFANPAFDLNGDGVPARTFVFDVFGAPRFTSLDGVFDTAVLALPGGAGNTCADPGAYLLQPFGKITFRGPAGSSLYADIDSSVNICYNPVNPNEQAAFIITGGTGIYAGKTGTGSATIQDFVRLAGPLGEPLYLDSHGSFTLTIN